MSSQYYCKNDEQIQVLNNNTALHIDHSKFKAPTRLRIELKGPHRSQFLFFLLAECFTWH